MINDLPKIPEELDEEIEAKLGSERDPDVFIPSGDPFSKELEDFKAPGLSDNMRKRKSRLLKSASGADGAKSKTNHEKPPKIATGYDLLQVAKPTYNLEYLSKLYGKDDTHFAAVQAKTANVVGLGFDLVDSNATRRRKDKLSENPDRKHKFENTLQNEKFSLTDRLEELNDDYTFLETLEKVYIDYETTGNGYLEIGRTKLGNIGYVGHVPAHTMRVRSGRDGFVQIATDKPVYFRNFGDRVTTDPIANDRSPNEIIHFKKHNPIDMYYGMPDIIPALTAIAGNSFADAFNLDYFENKAVPRHLVVVKGHKHSAKAQDTILKFFDDDLRGKHHRTLYLGLPADQQDRKSSIEIKPVEAGEQEASFSAYHKSNTQRILMVHRVPLVLLGSAENVPHAVGRMADKSFKELTVRPTQRKFEKRINKIIGEFTDMFAFRFNELTLTDEIQQSAIDTAYYNMDALLPNEVRARWGWPGLPNGEKTLSEITAENEVIAARQAESRQEQRSNDSDSRARDKRRNANRTDSVGEERSPRGEGRTVD